jgi:hypothetical protein
MVSVQIGAGNGEAVSATYWHALGNFPAVWFQNKTAQKRIESYAA